MNPEELQRLFNQGQQLGNEAVQLYQLRKLEEAVLSAQQAVGLLRQVADCVPSVQVAATLAATLHLLGMCLGALGRLEAALPPADEAVRIFRLLAAKNPEAFEPELAGSLTNASAFLSELGQRQKARDAAEEAVELYGYLVAKHPERFRPALAVVLNNLIRSLSELGQRDEALRRSAEAVELCRSLVAENPERFQHDLAKALNNQSVALHALGRREQALAAAEGAVNLYRSLVAKDPERFRPFLAKALNNQAVVLSALGRWEKTLAVAEDAVWACRALEAENPEGDWPDLAKALTILSVVLSGLGRWEKALVAAEDAAELYRSLAAKHPERFWPDLAKCLDNLSFALSAIGRREAALDAAEESVDLFRSLAAAHPERFRPDLGGALVNLSAALHALGRCEKALAAAEEAVKLYRLLAAKHPEKFEPELGGAFINLLNSLKTLGRLAAALSAAKEAVALCRKLAADHPERFRPDLGSSLNNMAVVLIDLGLWAEALAAVEEAVAIRRSLAAAHPERFRPDLTRSLINKAAVLHGLGQRAGALDPAREAVGIAEALDAELPLAHVLLKQKALTTLGSVLLELGKPERRSAYESFAKAVACAEAFRGSVESVEDRQRLSGEGFHAYAGLVEAGVALWEEANDAGALEAALAASEGVRGRSLLDRLGRVGAEPTGEAALQRWRELRRRLDAAEAAYRHSLKRGQDRPPRDGTKGQSKSASFGSAEEPEPEPEPEAPPVAELRRVLAERQALIAELRREPANRDFDPDRPVPVADVAGFRLWLAEHRTDAVVEYFVGERLACAFVVTPAGPLKVVRLPGLNLSRVQELGRQWRAGYDPKDKEEAQAWREDRDRHTAALRQWGEGLPAKLRELAELAVWPVLRALGLSPSRAQPGRLLVIPHWELGFFPLHACPLGQADPRLVAEVWEVAYAPVFSLLPMIGRRDAVGPAPSGLVANPTNDLAYTTLLGLEIEQQRQGIRTLWGSEADEAALLGLAAGSRDLFLCGHMQAGHGDSEPALVLALKQRLTVTDLYVKLRLPLGRMVVLNGCESGLLMPKVGGGTEYEGLPLAFLFRGASVVVSTGWIMFDISGALLMRRFLFELPRQQGLPGPALREATRWLREDIRNADELEREVEDLLAELAPAFKPDRHPLTSFAKLEADALEQVAYYRKASPNAPPFASPLHWAAHTVSGLAHAPVLA